MRSNDSALLVVQFDLPFNTILHEIQGRTKYLEHVGELLDDIFRAPQVAAIFLELQARMLPGPILLLKHRR